MSFDCWTLAFGTPNSTASTPYTIRSGDTLSGIAKRFGYASWKDIYSDPDNATFRQKRPNPDKIFPGDQLILPGRESSVPLESYSGYIGGGGSGDIQAARFPLGSGANTFALRSVASQPDPFALDYKQPGNVKLRVTLFWVTNCMSIDTSPRAVLDKAEALFAAHGLTLDIHPGRTRLPEFTIPFDDLITTSEQKNGIRLEGAKRFDDQKDTKNKKQRLPVFFCEFKDPANGLTITGDWLPYVFVSGVLAKDQATLAHEMVHASGIPGHDRAHRDNIMSEVTDNRSELFRSQVQQLAGAYFAK